MASNPDWGDNPNFTIDYTDPRPYVQEYKKASRFRPGDKVWYRPAGGDTTREGPFKVAKSPSAGKYILCLTENVREAGKGGVEIDEEDLELA